VVRERFAQTFSFSLLQKCKDSVAVAIGVSRNVKPGELTEYIDTTDIQADNDFFRSLGIFIFDGNKLQLEAKRFFRLGASATRHPSGKFLLSSVNPTTATFTVEGQEDVFRTFGASTGFWLKLKYDKCDKLSIKNADADLFPIQVRSDRVISGNGKWLLIASSDTPLSNVGCATGEETVCGQILFNLVLYRIEIC